MCNIGDPVEIIDVVLLELPKPLRRREQELPTEQPETVEVPVAEETTVVKL